MDFTLAGFTQSESTIVLGQIEKINGQLAKSLGMSRDDYLTEITTSAWPTISKAVSGGLEHVISVDNGANYAELFHRGGSWYAVTGALRKSGELEWNDISAMQGVSKNMSITEVVPIFLKSTGVCGCSGNK